MKKPASRINKERAVKATARQVVSRREANKLDKLDRIRRAAKAVFKRKGFDGATLREIADAAGVAFGTLFLYAQDKQDLLLLLFDEELPRLGGKAFERVDDHAPFVDQLIAFFGAFYDFFTATPALSRDMMKETTFNRGIVAKRVWTGIENTEVHLTTLVSRAQAANQLSKVIPARAAAHIIFGLFRIEIRFCLDDVRPDAAKSLARLRSEFELLMHGLAPRRAGDTR